MSYAYIQPYDAAEGAILTDANDVWICATPQRGTLGATAYHFDLHQVVEYPDSLYLFNQSASELSLRISGYELALP